MPPRKQPRLPSYRRHSSGQARRVSKPPYEKHLADLHNSGLSDAQIAACGFFSEYRPSEIAKLLNWKTASDKVRFENCLVIPYLDFRGKLTGYHRVKPDNPRLGDSGKPNKYEAPAGVPFRAYFPPGCTLA